MFLRISITIFFLLLISIGVRMYRLAHFGLNKYETVTLCHINGFEATANGGVNILSQLPQNFTREDVRREKTYSNVVHATIRDNGNSVAYNLMLSWWTKVFGNTNYSLRFLSLVFGVLTVILAYYFSRQLFNERTAVIAGLLLCLHPMLIEYAQLARSYVPATFFVLLSTYSLYQVSVSKMHLWLHIPLYVVAVMLSLLCHYLVVYVLVAHLVLLLFFHSHRKALFQYGVMGIVIAGLFSLWLFNGGLAGIRWQDKQAAALEERVEDHASQDERPSAATVGYHATINTAQVFGSKLHLTWHTAAGGVLYLVLPAVLLFFAFRKIRKSEYFRQGMFALFPIGIYFIFTVFMSATSQYATPDDGRYACFVMPFACILLAFGVDRMMADKDQFRRLSYVVLVLLCGTMIVSAFPQFFLEEEDHSASMFPYHNAADFIEKNSDKAEVVVFNNNKDALLTNLYINRKIDVMQAVDSTIDHNSIVLLRHAEEISSYTFIENR